MNPLTQFKTTTLLVIPLVLVCFGLSLTARAATPEAIPAITPTPDGCYPGFNTAEGCLALQNINTSIAQGNTALGFAALKFLTTGDNNTAVGVNALLNNATGTLNTAVGQAALLSNTTGDASTAIGSRALYSNTIGVANTAIGNLTLLANTSGELNTAIGFAALASNTIGLQNTGTGVRALVNNTIGFSNTAIGYNALCRNTNGKLNTAIGESALEFNTTGSGNVAVGVDAGQQIDIGSNNIDIGNTGVAGDANTIRFGTVQTRTFIAGIRGRATGVANAVPVLIDSNGQLGTASSSRRFKKEIKPMDQTSESILALKPVTFHYKSDATNTAQFGLIAEEVAAVNPDLVVRDENGEIYTVRYDAVNAMLLNEFLRQHRKVEQLKKDFESKLAEQQKQIEALSANLQKVSAQVELSKAAPQTVLNNR